MNEADRMKPIIVLRKGTMSAEDIKELRGNWLCVVESEDPSTLKFLDPIPAAAERTKVEDAALALSRKMLDPTTWTSGLESGAYRHIANTFVDLVMRGTRIDRNPSQQETERAIFDEAKAEELRRLAREEAKTERKAQREAVAAEQARLAAEKKAKQTIPTFKPGAPS